MAEGCAVGGPELAHEVRIFQVLSSIAIGFIPGVGDAYFLISAFAGEDLITGTKLSQSERLQYAGIQCLQQADAADRCRTLNWGENPWSEWRAH